MAKILKKGGDSVTIYDDIRTQSDDPKEVKYEAVHALYLQGKSVNMREHKSGFPALTIDCGDIHLLTDCLSLENWWAKKMKGCNN